MMMRPNPDLEILSQLIDDHHGTYRLRVKQRVHYLTITTDVFDEDTMCRPYLLIPSLPELPASPWTRMSISRAEDDSITTTISTDPLPEIEFPWHDTRIDVLTMKRTTRFNSGVYEVQYNGAPAVVKIACFEWDITRIEHETWVYSILASHAAEHPEEAPIGPKFLGHVTENDRIIGFLLEKVEGDAAGIDDLPGCEALLRRFHGLLFIHGDVNRYNFVVDRSCGGLRLIDFEHVKDFEEGLAREELLSLPAELTEESGRGTTAVEVQ